MHPHIINKSCCPVCKGNLTYKKDSLHCQKCKKKYHIKHGVPIFLSNPVAHEAVSFGSYREDIANKRPSFFRFFKEVHALLGPPGTTYERKKRVMGKKVPAVLAPMLKYLEGKHLLNIGSSSKKVYSQAINLDIGLYDNVDVVADGKQLPFKNNSFDGVIIEMVIEHVDYPEEILSEAFRVLKKGGKIYVSLPFVFAFHGSPDDYNRYTFHGLEKRLTKAGFSVEKSGALSGAGSTMSQISRYYFASLFSFNSRFLYSFWLNVFGWLTFWIKYTDALLLHYKNSYMLAATVYAIGKK